MLLYSRFLDKTEGLPWKASVGAVVAVAGVVVSDARAAVAAGAKVAVATASLAKRFEKI